MRAERVAPLFKQSTGKTQIIRQSSRQKLNLLPAAYGSTLFFRKDTDLPGPLRSSRIGASGTAIISA